MNKNNLELAQKMQGMKSLQTIMERMHVNRDRAIYVIHKLRKKGYVKTYHMPNKKRVYYISPKYAVGGVSYLDVINKYAPVATQILESEEYKFHGKEPSVEEALIYAIKQKKVRYLIVSLSLFRKIKDWPLLYKLAKKDNLLREVGALYDVARTLLKKLQKMPLRFKNKALPKAKESFKHMHEYKISSRDFKAIEKKWRVYIPLNISDLEEYRR